MTRYTSLVAVEEKISRPGLSEDTFQGTSEGTTLASNEASIGKSSKQKIKTQTVPLVMPAGNTMLLPQGSLDTRFKFLVSLLLTFFTILTYLATFRLKSNRKLPGFNHAVKTATAE